MKQSNMVKVFKALSNEQRLKLFKLIYDNQNQLCSEEDRCEGGLDKAFTIACEHLNISRSTVSHHMKELERSGLIILIRNGQSFRCIVNTEVLTAVRKFLE